MKELADYLDGERGRASALARAIALSPAFVNQLARGKRPVPADRCALIERASGGAVRRWHLRPNDWHHIWPELVGIEGSPALAGDDIDPLHKG